MILTLISALRGFLSGDGALILPEMELVLFACGILVIDRWLAANEKHWNALLALAGTVFSGFTLYVQNGKAQALRDANPESPGLLGFHQSVLVDPLFLFFAALFLAATALVVLFSVRYLELTEEKRGSYYALLLFACAGMMSIVSGVDMLVVFLGAQIMGLSFFLLAKSALSEEPRNVAAQNYASTWTCSSFALAARIPAALSIVPNDESRADRRDSRCAAGQRCAVRWTYDRASCAGARFAGGWSVFFIGCCAISLVRAGHLRISANAHCRLLEHDGENGWFCVAPKILFIPFCVCSREMDPRLGRGCHFLAALGKHCRIATEKRKADVRVRICCAHGICFAWAGRRK